MIAKLLRVLVPGVLLALLVAASMAPCFGQAFTASLTGLVTDPNAAVIPAASVKVRNINTNETRQTATNESGRFVFSQLLPGPYELTVEAKGFKTTVRADIVLRANQAAEVNAEMQIGQISESIEVSGTALLLETQSANQSVTMTRERLLELPVTTRNPFVVVHAMAGVTAMSTGLSNAVNDQNVDRFAFNGGRDMSGLVLIDGVAATAGDWGGLLASPSIESVNEVQVSRNSYDAEFGKSGGGVVSVVTKGGSSEFHGSAFEFLRNDKLDANAWSNNRSGRPKVAFHRNQFGGNISGPIWKSKRLFFMGTYERLKQSSPATTTATVPTDLERQGDFSRTLNANGTTSLVFDPFSTRTSPDGGFIRDPFPGNRVPQNRWDPVGASVVKLFPAANTTPTNLITQANNFFGAGASINDNHRMDVRIDWAANEKVTFNGRVTKAWQKSVTPRFYGTGADTGNQGSQPRYHITLGTTIVPNPRWVINLTLGSGRWREEQLPLPLLDGVLGTSIGLPSSLVSQWDSPHLPQFAVSGYSQLSNGRLLNFPRQTDNLQANVTRELGSHSLKFGATVEYAHLNGIDVRSADFAFDRGMTSGPVAQIASSTAGNSIASLLLGTGIGAASTGSAGGVTASNNAVKNTVTPATMQKYYGAYIQDVWHVSSRLTINAGMRYETQRPRTERFNRYNYFDFSAANPLSQRTGLNLKGGLVFVSPQDRGQTAPDNLDLAPRIGFAYKVRKGIVARGGYGIFYLQKFGNALQGGPASGTDGFTVTTNWVTSSGGDGLVPQDLLSNPYPKGLNKAVGSSLGLLTQTGGDITGAWQRPDPTGYTQNFSLDMQFELGRGSVFEIGYSGNVGRKLNVGGLIEANQLPGQYLSLGSALNDPVPNPFYGVFTTGVLSGTTVPRQRLLRPYPQFNSVQMPGDTPGASSSFNAMFLKFNKTFSNGLSLLASYQFSKAIDNASENQGWIINERFRDTYNRSLDRSISAHDVPHSMVTSIVYEIPVGKSRKFGTGMPAVADAVIGGWEIATVLRFATGLPQRLEVPNTLATYGYAILEPRIENLKDLGVSERTPTRWFNTDAAKQPAPFTLGNAPRYLSNLRADGTHHADVNISKNFKLWENVRMQFRGEFYDFTNTPQFSPPGLTLGAPDFGQVNGTRFNCPRNVQLGLKLLF